MLNTGEINVEWMKWGGGPMAMGRGWNGEADQWEGDEVGGSIGRG